MPDPIDENPPKTFSSRTNVKGRKYCSSSNVRTDDVLHMDIKQSKQDELPIIFSDDQKLDGESRSSDESPSKNSRRSISKIPNIAGPKTHRRASSLTGHNDPFSNAEIYYGPEPDPRRKLSNDGHSYTEIFKRPFVTVEKTKYQRPRTLSVVENVSLLKKETERSGKYHYRRGSEDDSILSSQGVRRFFISDVNATLDELLHKEDSDRNFQITVEDTGPKVLKLGTANSSGYKHVDIRGTYMLSNLLQELTLAQGFGRRQIVLDEARLNENPVSRLSRLISNQFWDNLTRRVDLGNIAEIAFDTKIDAPGAKNPRIYVPYNCPNLFEFYVQASQMHPSLKLEVEYLPKNITPDYVKSINGTPGMLALAMEEHINPSNGEVTLVGYPYAVPGGRFNELYGWDSYFITLGLIESNKVDVARGMVEHFVFEIEHYGKILNANRSYYLCRSQPPFLTDMALVVFQKMGGENNPIALDFLRRSFKAAIKEYKSVWCCAPRIDKDTGLSCYNPDGLGIPPETEANHFDTILLKFTLKYAVSRDKLISMYNNSEIHEPELDEFFRHDRAVRESGHDTTYRFEGICADLATIDLNSLLYKYENDIADVIANYFDSKYIDAYDGSETTPEYWRNKAAKRKENINKYMWDPKTGFYYDYNVKTKMPASYESATTFWALWAGLATYEQAETMINKALPKLEVLGGLVACSEESRGPLSVDRPSRQWDYPFGWSPHQIMAWQGLKDYGHTAVAARLSYRWLYMMTKAFIDYNGIVVEKYDITRGADPHRVDAEYGNQGTDFKGAPTEGFGWVNSSYLLGMKFMDSQARRALGACISPDQFFNNLRKSDKHKYAL